MNNTSSLKEKFIALTSFVTVFDPITLLLRLGNEFLFTLSNHYVEDGSITFEWSKWIEFLSGYLLSKTYPENVKTQITPEDIEQLYTLLKGYFDGVSSENFFSQGDISLENSTLSSAKSYSLHVRGTQYPHQMREMTISLYSLFEPWFSEKLGFTINTACDLSDVIIGLYNDKHNTLIQEARLHAEAYTDGLIKKNEVNENDKEETFWQVGYAYFMEKVPNTYFFTAADIANLSGYPVLTCESFLRRMSQPFGFRNQKYPHTYQDPAKAPWDYNTLYERPIVFHHDQYFLPFPPILLDVLFHTFYYDLIGDKRYWKDFAEAQYGKWLEIQTATAFKKIFPEKSIFLNPRIPGEEKYELCDVLILYQNRVFIVQCKTKKLRHESLTGKDFSTLQKDMEGGVKDSFTQGVAAREYLTKNPGAVRLIVDRFEDPLILDNQKISDIFLISVTLETYQFFTGRLSNFNEAFKLFPDKKYPWAVSLFDLLTICEFITSPALFIHYLKHRLSAEEMSYGISGDEIDYFGFYISTGTFFHEKSFGEIQGLALGGMSDVIDRYVHKKYILKEKVEKPFPKMPKKFRAYLDAVEKLPMMYNTDCAIALLNLSYQAKEEFIKHVEATKHRTIKSDRLQSLSMPCDSNIGFSFISMNTQGNLTPLYQQVRLFSLAKKYDTKFKTWVCLGWEKNSKKLIDVIDFLSFDWKEDVEMESLTKIALQKVPIEPK